MAQEHLKHQEQVNSELEHDTHTGSEIDMPSGENDLKDSMSTESHTLAKESDKNSLQSMSENETEDKATKDKDFKDYVDVSLPTIQCEMREEDEKAPLDPEPFNDHGRALPLKQFIIVYTGYML
jgi:hypothetical protein